MNHSFILMNDFLIFTFASQILFALSQLMPKNIQVHF